MKQEQYEAAKQLREKIDDNRSVIDLLKGKEDCAISIIITKSKQGAELERKTLTDIDDDTVTALRVAFANANQLYENKFAEL